MFRWLRDRIRFFQLDRKERSIRKEGERRLAESRWKNDQTIIDKWYDKYGADKLEEIRWERQRLVSEALLSDADKLHLPRPDYDDQQQWVDVGEYPELEEKILTDESRNELRIAIRKERKERLEIIEWRVKLVVSILAGLTGLVGALIGLAAIWKHR